MSVANIPNIKVFLMGSQESFLSLVAGTIFEAWDVESEWVHSFAIIPSEKSTVTLVQPRLRYVRL